LPQDTRRAAHHAPCRRALAASPELDLLTVNGLAGNDTIDGSGLAADAIGFQGQP